MKIKINTLLTVLLINALCLSLQAQDLAETKYNLSKLNVVYVDVENPVTFYDLNPGDTIVGEGFKIFQRQSQYIIIPQKIMRLGALYVLNSKKDTVSSFNLRVLKLPTLSVSFVGMKEGLIPAGKLKAGTQLKAEINCPFDVKVKVSGFTLTVHSGQTKTITEFKSRSGKLSGKMKLALKNVQRGDRVYFEDIRVKLSTGKTQKIPSLIFKVK